MDCDSAGLLTPQVAEAHSGKWNASSPVPGSHRLLGLVLLPFLSPPQPLKGTEAEVKLNPLKIAKFSFSILWL